jgi:hypothetical protein
MRAYHPSCHSEQSEFPGLQASQFTISVASSFSLGQMHVKNLYSQANNCHCQKLNTRDLLLGFLRTLHLDVFCTTYKGDYDQCLDK